MRVLRGLYFQVLLAVILGVVVGVLAPSTGEALKPLGDGFIKLIKMLVAPVVFVTVVSGIARMRDLKTVGRIGGLSLIYFEVVTTFALVIGLLVGEVVRPGEGLHVDVSKLDPSSITEYAAAGKTLTAKSFLLNLVPGSFFAPFVEGDVLQVLVISVLLGVVVGRLKLDSVTRAVHVAGEVVFGVVAIVMRLAPVGAFGAMAYTVGKYGLHTLWGLGQLVGCFYATVVLFVVLVLGTICRLCGLSIFRLVAYLKDELLLVLGTSSSESALPRLIRKLEGLGCPEGVVGLVVPMGYSFNLDGTSIYLTLASLFVAQATDTHISLGEELALLLVLLLTSKGAAAVTGSGFVTLAATLSATGRIPVVGLVLLLGVDKFMSEARALTNLVGNAVATIAIARSQGALDVPRARTVLARGTAAPPESASADRAGVSGA